MPFAVLALLLAAAVGGGVSFAAQSALPGDALWGFKVGVNERLQDAVAQDGTAQAEFDIAATATRLREAAALAADGRLTAAATADIKQNLAFHADSIQKQVTILQEQGAAAAAADVAARFQAALIKEISGALDIRALLDEASRLSEEASEKAK